MLIFVLIGIFRSAGIISADFVLRPIIKNYTAIILTYYYKRLVR